MSDFGFSFDQLGARADYASAVSNARQVDLLNKQTAEMQRLLMLGKEIPCPYCAQLISKDALVCNQCHGNLGIASWAAIRAALIHEPKLANKDPESVNQLHQTAQRIDHDWAEAARKKKEAEELAARQRATAIAEAAEAKRIADAEAAELRRLSYLRAAEREKQRTDAMPPVRRWITRNKLPSALLVLLAAAIIASPVVVSKKQAADQQAAAQQAAQQAAAQQAAEQAAVQQAAAQKAAEKAAQQSAAKQNAQQDALEQARQAGRSASEKLLRARCGDSGARANLTNCNLHGANLSYADLESAILSGANLSGANLSHASLGGAILTDTDLTNTNLNAAFLDLNSDYRQDTDLTNALFTNTTCPDGSNSDDNGGSCDGHYGDFYPSMLIP